ncbi:MAG: carbamoyltransferase C-terminal domain-containing protein [Candidatus Micrarchaeota archaeon]
MVLILGLHVGHCSSVCLMRDGEIVFAVQQERFDKVKNSSGFPKDAIDWTLKTAGISAGQLDSVAVGGLTILPAPLDMPATGAKTKMSLTPKALVTRAWRNIDYKHQNLRKLFLPLVIRKRENTGKAGREALKGKLNAVYGIPAERIHFVEHHVCHAYSAYYGQRRKEKNPLVLTVDGEGDYYCAGVNRIVDGKIERVASTPFYNSIGYVYSITTTYLGMKALEHEYKVMGLAPYAKEYFKKTYENVFKGVIDVDSEKLVFTSPFPLTRFMYHLQEKAGGERFDNISAALQYLTEDVVGRWTKASLDKLGGEELYMGGGVFMNVKMNMKLAELPEVKNISPFPSGGDESNPFGACYYVYLNVFGKKPIETKRVKDVYLGPEYTNEYIEEVIKERGLKQKYNVEFYKDVEGEIAELLGKDKIVARLAGKSEWGARALGNRSILGNPSKMQTFYKVNDQIKMRDFWMPFAPSILFERGDDYVLNPKKLDAPYMIMAFHSTPLAQQELIAGIHQADKTCRPQLLEKEWNPGYYRIIKEFEKETGIGGVLNTSFNLHGEPMVESPEDAIHTFEDSGLEYLAMENWIVSKK